MRGLEQGSAALWAFQRAVWQLQRIGWALDALRVHPSPRVWEGPWASDSALAGVVGLRMVATITCAMTCNYMVHPRLEGGLFLGRDEGMRLQPKMVALASINPGRLTPAKLHIAPHLRSKDAHSRLAPSHSQKASSFSWNCLRNCIATVTTEIGFLPSASRKFLCTDLLSGLGAVPVRICHLMYSTYLPRAIHNCT